MKTLRNLAIGAMLMAGAATGATLATTAPAEAHVSVGIGIGIPGPEFYPVGNPCLDPDFAYYHPGRCSYPAYYDPVYIGGAWYSGPHYYRYWRGRPYVYYGGHWRSDFRGGARWGGGHWSGHGRGYYHGGRGGHDGYHGGHHHH